MKAGLRPMPTPWLTPQSSCRPAADADEFDAGTSLQSQLRHERGPGPRCHAGAAGAAMPIQLAPPLVK